MAKFLPSTAFLGQVKQEQANTKVQLLDVLADELMGYHPDAYTLLQESKACFAAATPSGYELSFGDEPTASAAEVLQSLYDDEEPRTIH